MQINIVTKDAYVDVWPYIKEYMEGAAKYTYGRFTSADILHDLLHRELQLWVAVEDDEIYGAVVTEIISYPRLNALVMHFTGGHKLPKWKNEMLKTLQHFAKNNTCSIIESYGRPGWGKVFKHDGYVARYVYYELPVETEL